MDTQKIQTMESEVCVIHSISYLDVYLSFCLMLNVSFLDTKQNEEKKKKINKMQENNNNNVNDVMLCMALFVCV